MTDSRAPNMNTAALRKIRGSGKMTSPSPFWGIPYKVLSREVCKKGVSRQQEWSPSHKDKQQLMTEWWPHLSCYPPSCTYNRFPLMRPTKMLSQTNYTPSPTDCHFRGCSSIWTHLVLGSNSCWTRKIQLITKVLRTLSHKQQKSKNI